MTLVKRPMLLSMAAALLIWAAGGVALADGGGGGGSMGSMPSMSTPSYDAAAEYAKGVAALRDKDYKGAEKAFGHVLTVTPKNADVLLLMGAAQTEQGNLKGGRRSFEKVLKIDPDRVAGHQALGVTLARLKETDKAQAELDLLKAKAATCGETCPQAGELKGAVTAVEAALSPLAPAALRGAPPTLVPDAAEGDHAYLTAVGLINDRRYPEALSALGAAETAFGPHPDVLTYIGYTHRKLGDYAHAETYYRQALAIDPDHRGATEYYGELKVERGDMAGARRMLAKLDDICGFGCPQAEDLRRWIDLGHEPPR
ncbi:tetratricopeptide repeat protein [Caulobacter sp. AP07]|uniref:tetratricopeptide repeat protein n=1 Tax=Caulobacter sp. AP07 TaxID=1144304 RepID=UPI00138AEB86|nr:tetratricopeptide repeat protein [Caulobacter sp. AP07]